MNVQQDKFKEPLAPFPKDYASTYIYTYVHIYIHI